MNLKIEQKIFEQYPDLILGVVILHEIDNQGDNPEIANLLRNAEASAMGNLGNTPLIEQTFIASWREAYRKFGAKPKDYSSSIENLLRRILKGEKLRHINKLVDLYNIISLEYLVPVGGEDLAKINGDILLTFAGEDESPIVLLGEQDARPPYQGEVIYKDDIGTICRRWNWKEADRTKLTEETKNAFIVIEGLPPVDRDKIQKSVTDLAEIIEKYCKGHISTVVLDKSTPQTKLI